MDGKTILVEFDFFDGKISEINYSVGNIDIENKYGVVGITTILIDKINDWKKVIINIYNLTIHEIEDCQGLGKGHPDFYFLKEGKKVYVECKQNGDGLRYEQMKWIFENVKKGERVKVLWFQRQKMEEETMVLTENEAGMMLAKGFQLSIDALKAAGMIKDDSQKVI